MCCVVAEEPQLPTAEPQLPPADPQQPPAENNNANAAQYWRGVIKAMAPRAAQRIIDGLGDEMPRMVEEFALNTPLRQAHFLAQCAHESASFTVTTEFASGAAYEGRRDLGNTQPGDGRRFKGRGLIQLTGRSNYQRFGTLLGINLVANPESAAEFPTAALTAGLYWKDRSINSVADRDDVVGVTRKVNGGTNGLADRKRFLSLAKSALRTAGAAPRATTLGGSSQSVVSDFAMGIITGVLGTILVVGVAVLLAWVVRKRQAKYVNIPQDEIYKPLLDGSSNRVTPRLQRRGQPSPNSPAISTRKAQ